MLPLFPLGTVLFPGRPLPLRIFEPRYVALASVIGGRNPTRELGVVTVRAGREVGAGGFVATSDVGCSAVVQHATPTGDGAFEVLVQGARRFRVDSVDLPETPGGAGYQRAQVRLLDPGGREAADLAEPARRLLTAYHGYCDLVGAQPLDLADGPPEALAWTVADLVPLALTARLEVLAVDDPVARLELVGGLVTTEIDLVRELRAFPRTQPLEAPTPN